MVLALSMMLTMLAACNNEPVVDETPDDGQQQEDIQPNDPGDEVVSDVLNLVVDGVSDYVIVRGENAYISEVTASTELQKYLKQISGVEIPIVTDATPAVEKEIVVGKTNREADGEFDRDELGDDGLVIKSNGQKLFLVGGEQKGTLYAVYEFLEAYLGCRFYTSKFEKIPEMKTISFEKIEENKQIPSFATRIVHWADYSGNDYFSTKRKTIICKWGRASEIYGGNPIWINIGGDVVHSLGTLAEIGRSGQPCLTDENTFNTVLKNVKAYLYDNPDADIISVSQNDNENYCKCDNCKAKVAEYGNMGGLNIWFVNKIANELKSEFPDVLVHTFAYRYTRHVPTGIKPAENVIVELCSIEACFRHPLSECTDYSDENFADLIKGWGEICDNLYIWDYTTNYANYIMTFPNFEVLKDNLKLFADCGVAHVLEQGNYSTVDSGEFGELRCYLLSHLLWDPYISEEELYELKIEFMKDFYGPGWEFILKYLNLAHEITSDICFDIYSDPSEIFPMPEVVEVNPSNSYPPELSADMIINYKNYDWTKYWNWFKTVNGEYEFLTEGKSLFAEAMKLAETDDQKTRIGRCSVQIDYIESYYLEYKLKAGNGSIGKIIANYYTANPDAVDSGMKNQLRIEVLKSVNDIMFIEYEEFNRAFAEKILKYGINNVREGFWMNEDTPLNLRNLPEDWDD